MNGKTVLQKENCVADEKLLKVIETFCAVNVDCVTKGRGAEKLFCRICVDGKFVLQGCVAEGNSVADGKLQ